MTTTRGRALLALGLLLGIYSAGVQSVMFAPVGSDVASWWPAAGLSVTVLVLTPRRWWPLLVPGIVLVSGLANYSGGRGMELSALFGVANAAEALVAGIILRRGRSETAGLESQDDLIRLIEGALAGAFVAACGAGAVVARLEGGSFAWTWQSVFASHAAATLVLLPVALTLRQGGGVRRRTELTLQCLLLLAVTAFVLAPQQSLPLLFLPLPFMVWAALRFDIRVVAWQLAGFSIFTTYVTALDYGPLGSSFNAGLLGPGSAAALTQGYLLCAAVMTLPLAIAVEQRRVLLSRVTDSELLFRRNFTESLVGMLLLRCEGLSLRIVDLNDTAVRLLGGDREPLLGQDLDRILETREQLDLVAGRMLQGHLEGWKAQTGLVGRPDARVNVALSRLSGDEAPMFSAQLQDMTAEYEARSQLEAAEKLTSATLDTTACVILVTDMTGTIVRVNSATSTLTGFSEAELLGRPVWETSITPADAADVEAIFLWPNRSGVPVLREADATTKRGDRLRIVWNSNLVHDERGNPMYAVLTGIDVTAERATAGLISHLLQAAITTALIGIDTEGRITVFNSGAQNLLGYEPHEMVGQPFSLLLEPRELMERTSATTGDAAFRALTAELESGAASEASDWTWVDKSGHPHTISMTLSVAADAFAAQVGFLCVGRDVTEQRHSQEMLVSALDKERTAVERLRQLDAAKNEFVSTVSHELRTPITSIVGYTEMLADGSIVDPDPDQLPLLATIARNGERLIDICNDLLLLSGLDSNATHWEREALDVASIMDPVQEAIHPLVVGRDLKVEFIAHATPLVVLGDRSQLERVLINLVSNAIKFTENGGTISCRVEPHGAEAWLVVSDTGIGIPQDEQASLFQKFFRSSTAQDRAIQGTGLGLSIVAAIVAAHGGRIGVKSAHLEGTTFTVQLPLKRVGARV